MGYLQSQACVVLKVFVLQKENENMAQYRMLYREKSTEYK